MSSYYDDFSGCICELLFSLRNQLSGAVAAVDNVDVPNDLGPLGAQGGLGSAAASGSGLEVFGGMNSGMNTSHFAALVLVFVVVVMLLFRDSSRPHQADSKPSRSAQAESRRDDDSSGPPMS
eukprot:GHVT01010530.1.p1 GENE.GHVT01010530.1~~GHVT01010530.1.p1  ORF type:complete len:122 (+),score=20.83 GHVT01010530.1:828-1193(+)